MFPEQCDQLGNSKATCHSRHSRMRKHNVISLIKLFVSGKSICLLDLYLLILVFSILFILKVKMCHFFYILPAIFHCQSGNSSCLCVINLLHLLFIEYNLCLICDFIMRANKQMVQSTTFHYS